MTPERREHVRLWLSSVLGSLAGWIHLRALDPDQKRSPRIENVRTIDEAEAWCARFDGDGRNLYCGLARRGEQRDDHGRIEGGESNLAGCQVLWADLDSGTREEQLKRVREFPLKPTLLVDSGGGLHALWKLDDPIECASDPQANARLRNILKGVQVVIGGDPAVVDPSRIFRIAGTTNYPNARKRAQGRDVTESSILEHDVYTVTLDDFDMFEHRGETELNALPAEVHGHSERVPPAVAVLLDRVPKMRAVFYCERRLEGKSPSDEDFAIAAGLVKHAPWLRDGDVVAALRYRRIALAHLVRGSEKSRGYYPTTVRKARERARALVAPPEFEREPARWFQSTLTRALDPQTHPTVATEIGNSAEYPRISSSCDELDAATGGGAYGLTAFAGDSGVGKSTLALNVALIAKRAGWDVLYIAAEMDQADYEVRASRFLGVSLPELRTRDLLPTIAHVFDGLELSSLVDLILTTPTDETQRFLLCIDSLTKVAAYIDHARNGVSFFEAMARLTRLSEAAVRYGDRRIAVLVTSELNRDREAVGRRLTYAASLQVDLRSDKDAPELVNISIPKGRYSGKRALLGPFVQDWQRHRLARLSAPIAEAPSAEPEPEPERELTREIELF